MNYPFDIYYNDFIYKDCWLCKYECYYQNDLIILLNVELIIRKSEKMKDMHVFCFNPGNNGGEQLTLITKINKHRYESKVELEQTLTLESYSNSASFTLAGAQLTPELLRKLADELEEKINKIE